MISLAICGSPRTGGNWLCEMLRNRGMGWPDEYLSERIMKPLLREWRIGPHEYWGALWRKRTINNIFAVKIHWGELAYPHVGGDPRNVLPFGIPIIWLFQTRNIRTQAISWAQARRTHDWFGKKEDERASRDEVDELLPLCRLERESWLNWFSSQKIKPYKITYEALARDSAKVLDKIKGLVCNV